MKYMPFLLATSPVIAQIVPENKGTPLPVADANSPQLSLLFGGSVVCIALLILAVVAYKLRHRKHSRFH